MNDPFAQDHEVEPLMDDFSMGAGKGALRRKEDQANNQVSLSWLGLVSRIKDVHLMYLG